MPSHFLKFGSVLALLAITACGPGQPPEQPAPGRRPTLRLVSIRPELASRVDSLTVIEATLVYDVPGFEPDDEYWIMPTFVATNGTAFNRPPQTRVRVTSATGAATVRYPLRELLRDQRLASPLTGQFFLLEVSAPLDTIVRDTIIAGQRRMLRVRSRGAVRARSHSFFYNGGGPAAERRGQTSLPDALEEYFTFSPRRAFAVARDSAGGWVSGYAVGYARRDSAVARALRECGERRERRALAAECVIVAVDDIALAPGDPVPAEAAQEMRSPGVVARVVRSAPVRVPARALLIDSTSYDLDADGSAEHVALYAEVERDAAGRPLWEDAHRWLLLVRDDDHGFVLVSTLVPFGHMTFTIVAVGDDVPHIVAERHGGSGVTFESFSWDRVRGVFVGRILSVPGSTIFRSRDVR